MLYVGLVGAVTGVERLRKRQELMEVEAAGHTVLYNRYEKSNPKR